MMIRFIGLFLLVSMFAMMLGCEIDESDPPSSDGEGVAAEAAARSSKADSSPSTNLSYGGFLWKPVSEGDRNLVVLLPAQLTGNVVRSQVVVSSNEDGTGVIEVGRFAGDTHNGGREHYRFSQPGAGYGKNIYVHAVLKDGGEKSWFIPDGSRRVD